MQPSPNNLRLVPYVEVNGTRTLPDSFLAEVFRRMKSEGLIETVFAGYPNIQTDAQFIALMRMSSNLPVFVVHATSLADAQCLAFAWLNGVGPTYAYGHFCSFENPYASPVEMGHRVMNYWWSTFGLRVLLGTIPSFNQRAIAFVQKLGFVKAGEIPQLFMNPHTHESGPATILYCERPGSDDGS